MSRPVKNDDKSERITSRGSRRRVSKARDRIKSKLDKGEIGKKKAVKRLTKRIEKTTQKETDRIGGGRNTSDRVRSELFGRLINSAKRRYGRG